MTDFKAKYLAEKARADAAEEKAAVDEMLLTKALEMIANKNSTIASLTKQLAEAGEHIEGLIAVFSVEDVDTHAFCLDSAVVIEEAREFRATLPRLEKQEGEA